MGFEIILGVVSAAVGIAGAFVQAGAAQNAAAEQREARRVEQNQQQIEGNESRRQRIREERIRRARIMQGAENTGTAGSSGEIGALGALSTNLGSMFSMERSRSTAGAAISQANQNAADFLTQADTIGAWSKGIQGALNTFNTVFDK